MKTIMKELNSLEEFEELYNNSNITIFTFSADYCPDCHFIRPFMPKLMTKYDNFNFIYVDTRKYPEIAKEYKILGIPSFLAVKEGKELARFVSRLRKTETEIDSFLATIA